MRKTNKQAVISIHFGRKKCFIGIALAIVSFLMCQMVAISNAVKAVFLVAFFVLSLVEIDCSRTVAKLLTIIWCIGATFATVFTCQLLLNESTFSLGVQRILINMAICAIVMGLLYAITARLRLSVIVGLTVLMIFTAANYFVFKFRGSELCPADFLSLRTVAAVADRYTFSVDAPFVYAVVLAALFSFSVFCINKNEEGGTIRNRIFAAIGIVLLLLGLILGTGNLSAYHFLQTGSVANGYFLNFCLQIQENIVAMPNGYNPEIVQIYAEQYQQPDITEDTSSPDIIVIMNESFADLSILGDNVRTNHEITPYLNSLRENVVRGWALSSVMGGGTANSEYEFLSGNTMGFLPSGSIVYQQFVDENCHTIVPYLKALGYHTVATHPCPGENWMRDSVYPLLGFDEMHFEEDYPREKLLREFVSDQEMYEQIITWYEARNREQPFFLFGVTMQNHGFYDYSGSDFTSTVCLNGYAKEYPNAEQYLSVLQQSDAALEYIIQYFESVDRDVVILLYGDHFPKLDDSFFEEIHGGVFETMDEQMLRYTVPFLIWANFDIGESFVDLTSLNFLSNYLLQAAGLQLPAYNQFLEDVHSEIPAMNSFGYYSLEQGGIHRL